MATRTPRIDVGANIAVDSLKEPLRQQLMEKVLRLQDMNEADWPADEVKRLPMPEPIYMIRLPPYRVFLRRLGEHDLEISDIAHEETLRLWFSGEGKNGGPGE